MKTLKNQHKQGFTMIEVSLFLALSGAIILGLVSATNAVLHRQRYNDSVQSFAEFLRTVYSEVENTEGVVNGRNLDYAIYGKLISFGEEYDTSGDKLSASEVGTRVYTYTLAGEIKDDNYIYSVNGGSVNGVTAIQALRAVDTVLMYYHCESTTDCDTMIADSYYTEWDATIETTNTGRYADRNFKGALLIFRSPVSGTIYTYYTTEHLNINSAVGTGTGIGNVDWINVDYQLGQVDFCINSADASANNGIRQNIRINANAHNSSAVEITSLNEMYDQNANPQGNKCGKIGL